MKSNIVIPAKAGILFFNWRQRIHKIPAFAGMTATLFFLALSSAHAAAHSHGATHSHTTAHAAAAPSVYLEDLTWMEVKDRMKAGATTVIIPTGGTEQNGPHMVIGKHNIIVRYTAGKIAEKLGNALVAPVIAYVPEGRISPPEGHMQFPGTISVSEQTFAYLLEDAARSLKQHGFRLICFVGDHGGNQTPQQQVADKLNAEWRGEGVKVLQVSDYYSNNGQDAWTEAQGIKVTNPGAHASHEDTSELMAIDPNGIRDDKRGPHTKADFPTIGAMGDSSQASAEYGKHYLGLKVDAAVKQIQNAAAP